MSDHRVAHAMPPRYAERHEDVGWRVWDGRVGAFVGEPFPYQWQAWDEARDLNATAEPPGDYEHVKPKRRRYVEVRRKGGWYVMDRIERHVVEGPCCDQGDVHDNAAVREH